MKLIAYCTKGLEKVGALEITTKFSDAKDLKISDKRITFESEQSFSDLTKLRTIDDISLIVGEISNLLAIREFDYVIDNIPFDYYFGLISKFRDINKTFSITSSIVGLKKITPEAIQTNLTLLILRKYNLEYTPLDHGNFDIRIFCDYGHTYLSIRITQNSLMKRYYKVESSEGSLRATIAASMVIGCGQVTTKNRLLDLFCGSGTILCEAVSEGYEVYGSDINCEAVENSKKNMLNVKLSNGENIRQYDATKTKWESNYFDFIVSNLPWDKQIKVERITDLYFESLREMQRLLKKDGTICVLVVKPELFIKQAKKVFKDKIITSHPIHLLGMSPSIIYIK
ncbi:MAG: methyltransferase domain-containing protein [bacterium]|nr:methyltransferase domain-containing protein [bacterium]